MKNIVYLLLILFITSACTLEEAEDFTVTTGSADFTRLVAVGGSMTAGFQSGALTSEHQQYSFPALIARQAGVGNFEQPLLEYPGVGNFTAGGAGILELQSFFPLQIVPEPYSGYSDFDPQSPYLTAGIANRAEPYHNLGIPGVLLADLLISKTTQASFSQSLFLDIVLKNENKSAAQQKTAVGQTVELEPTFIVCMVGLSDVIRYGLTGGEVEEFLTSIDDFETFYDQLIDSLSVTSADIVVSNLPYVQNLAYFTTVPPYVFDMLTTAPILDDDGNLIPLVGVESSDLVLLSALDTLSRGTGIPEEYGGNGNALPEVFVLDSDERFLLTQHLDAFNNHIAAVAAGQDIPMVDLNNFIAGLSLSGYKVSGVTFDGEFLRGGFFSLDGLHPTDAGNALIANLWIDVINEHFDAQIPPVNVIGIMGD